MGGRGEWGPHVAFARGLRQGADLQCSGPLPQVPGCLCPLPLPSLVLGHSLRVEGYRNYEEMDELPAESLFPDPALEPDALCEGGVLRLQKPPASSVPDFLPSTQRALYLRIQHKQQQEEEERARRQADGCRPEREHEEGKWCQQPCRVGWSGGGALYLLPSGQLG